MATPTKTIQYGKAQGNTGAATGGLIPFGVTNQSSSDETFIRYAVYKRAPSTTVMISTGQVFNITNIETTVGAQEKSATDASGQTANRLFHDEYIELTVQGHPMGSALAATANIGALLGAYLPPPGSYVIFANAPVLQMGWIDGQEVIHYGDSAQGDALNSMNWQVQPGARLTQPGDAYWGVTFTVRRYKSVAMDNPASAGSGTYATEAAKLT